MKVLLISEHYECLIGGTAIYTDSVSNALAFRKIEVELIVPNDREVDELKIVSKNDFLRVHYIGSPQIKRRFCH